MICIPLAADTNEAMLARIALAETQPAACYEYRLDSLTEPPEVERLLAAASRPVVATCRAEAEGGGHRGGAAERRDILRRAARAGAGYVDVEAADVPALEGCGCIRIASLHDFAATPADLEERVMALAVTGAEWVKFAVAAHRHDDNLAVFAALARCPKPTVAIAMGETGLASRILGPSRGSRLAFGSLDAGLESAPGQTTAAELAHLYRVDAINDNTAVDAVLYHPDAPGDRHLARNRTFAESGEDAVCIPFYAGDPADFFASMPRGLGLRRIDAAPAHAAAALAWADADATVQLDDGWVIVS